MEKTYKGSCLCGEIKFTIAGGPECFFLCHCKHCQKDTGSAHSANLFFNKADVKWLSGQEKVKQFNLPSTRHSKSFCSHCGSALPDIQMEGKLIVVPAGSLDSDLSIKPTAHIFTSSKASWEDKLDSLHGFENFPG